ELDKAAQFFYSNAYSDNTKRTYTSHKNSYINFCTQFGYPAIPASTQTLCRYAAFLSKSLKFNSIKQYLNIVRILHAEWNLPNPLSNNFILNCKVSEDILAMQRSALFNAAQHVITSDINGPAFVYRHNGQIRPLTSEQFIDRVKECLRLAGIDTSDIASHSFRRGGATFCFKIGLSPDAIKLLGDWRSHCYQNYISNDVTTRYTIIQSMQRAIQNAEHQT
ncbi:hypothetical protein MAR_037885, partial [Mya arenaria]